MARHLSGFSDLLQVDGYGAYRLSAKGLRAKDGVTLASLTCPCQEAIVRVCM